MGRLPIKAWASVAILTTALASPPAYAADKVGVCGTIRLAETAVAMLDNQPIVKVFANSAMRCDPSRFTCVRERSGAVIIRVEFTKESEGLVDAFEQEFVASSQTVSA
jgi:hypothetical protein